MGAFKRLLGVHSVSHLLDHLSWMRAIAALARIPTYSESTDTMQALVGNLPYSAREDDVADFFHQCTVTDIYLVKDRETGNPKVRQRMQ